MEQKLVELQNLNDRVGAIRLENSNNLRELIKKTILLIQTFELDELLHAKKIERTIKVLEELLTDYNFDISRGSIAARNNDLSAMKDIVQYEIEAIIRMPSLR